MRKAKIDDPWSAEVRETVLRLRRQPGNTFRKIAQKMTRRGTPMNELQAMCIYTTRLTEKQHQTFHPICPGNHRLTKHEYTRFVRYHCPKCNYTAQRPL